jgi:hypothetical protein
LASATDAVPEISSSRMATVHMVTASLPITDDAGADKIPVADQRCRNQASLQASWALRDPRALAWITALEW